MLELRRLTLGYSDLSSPVVRDISLSLQKGEIGCLLGPSGCGKTTLLRAIAGFEKPLAGEIVLSNNVIASHSKSVPSNKRNIGMVFQDFALFPHLTVAENVGFGLSKMPVAEKRSRVRECLILVGLEQYESKFPHELSGGQQQRVALARAIAPNPDLILFDEPFSSLDAKLREQLATEIRRLLKLVNATAIIVTHDQHEAFSIADKIAVINDRVIHQWGAAYELYHQPATAFVAQFVGEGVFLNAQLTSDQQISTAIGDFSVANAYFGEDLGASKSEINWRLLVRPDDILHDDNSPFKARVINRVFRGSHILYRLALINSSNQEGEYILCLAPSHHDHAIGEYFGIRLALEHKMLFPK